MLEQIIAKQTAMNEQIKALREEAGALVKPMLQEFIKTYPEVKQIKWTQYTPYFNDGDTCTFSIHGFGFFFEGDDLDDSYYDHEIYGDKADQACSAETWEACKKLEADLNSIEDALHDLFGDHVEVIVKPDGVEVEEHEHD